MGLFQITAVTQNWVTQFAICGHDTQTFTSEQNLKLLGLFPDIRDYEVFSNVWRVQLSTSSSQNLIATRACGQQLCLIGGHTEVTINWGGGGVRNLPPKLQPHMPFYLRITTFVQMTPGLTALVLTIYRCLQVHTNLVTSQTDRTQMKNFLVELLWMTVH